MVIACVIGIFIFKEFLYTKTSNTIVVNIVPALINSVQIFIFNAIYQTLALKMTKFENHKYFNTYESSLVFKIFLFNHVNTFKALLILGCSLISLFPGMKTVRN